MKDFHGDYGETSGDRRLHMGMGVSAAAALTSDTASTLSGRQKGIKLGGQRYFTLSFMSFIKDVHFSAKPEKFIDPFHNMADKMLSICLIQLGLL